METKPRSKLFTYIGEYKYCRVLIYGGLLAVILLLIYVFSLFNFDFRQKLYVNCPGDVLGGGDCENPIYKSEASKYCYEDWCALERLPAGKYGTPPPDGYLFIHFDLISLLIIIIMLILNHVLFNWGKVPRISVPVPDRVKAWFNKIQVEEDEIDKKED